MKTKRTKKQKKEAENRELMRAWNQGVAARIGLLVYPIIKDVMKK